MNVLVLGDGHIFGYGLPAGQRSYLAHFVQQMMRTGQSVSVEAQPYLTMPQALSSLSTLPLHQYDLIILQTDATLLQPVVQTAPVQQPCQLLLPALWSSPVQIPRSRYRFTQLLHGLKTGVQALWSRYTTPRTQTLSVLLKRLRPYRCTVLLMTPMPASTRLSRWQQRQCRTALLRRAGNQAFSVFDVNSVIQPRDEYFQTQHPAQLNAVGHELLGRALFDFYQSAPTIITVQAIRRG
ncbi:hypothetical protein [Spirosoma montaniterrae]|uniref:SGNH hydrolase-type esterase domain-containing protein n=1 Tax=Spirosoma montaniterrae TaxID=1178516 RepID=A0A1P9WXC4_9BACT|nr:hypothetical protein [Spirosoma montaniterrae]AQG80037.1 hypothetical protein AWR27_12315 [Spirosoma montaniterrae]